MRRSAKKALALAVSGICIPVILPAEAHAGTPTVSTWKATGSGNYFTATNWTSGVPSSPSGTYEALFANTNEPVKNFTVTATQTITATAIIDNLSNFGNNTLLFIPSPSPQSLDLTGQTYVTQAHGTLSNVILANDNGTAQTNSFTIAKGLNIPLQNANNTIVTSGGVGAWANLEIDSNISNGVAGTASAVQIDGGGTSNFDGGIVNLTGTNTFSGGLTIGNPAGTQGGAIQLNPDGISSGAGTLAVVGANSLGTGNVVINEQSQILLQDNSNGAPVLYYGQQGQTITLNGIGINKSISGDIRTNFGKGVSTTNTITFVMLNNTVIGTSDPNQDQGLGGYIVVSATKQAYLTIDWDGVVTGTANSVGIDKQGGGNLEFSNPSNAYGGGIQIGNGEITVDNNSSMGTGDLFMAQTSNNPTYLALNNAVDDIGNLSSTFLDGSLQNLGNDSATAGYHQHIYLNGNGTTATDLIVNEHGNTSYGYPSQAGFNTLYSRIEGLGTLTLVGTQTTSNTNVGTLTLTGSNTYQGGTDIKTGTLIVANGNGLFSTVGGSSLVDAGSATGTGDVTVEGHGALMSGSNTQVLGISETVGTVSGNVYVQPGGVINPGGVLQAGTLYIGGNLNTSAGSNLDLDLVGATSASSDLLVIGGNLNSTLGATNVNISDSSMALGTYTLATAQAFSSGTATLALVGTPTPLPTISRSYALNQTNPGTLLLVVTETGNDRFWSVGGSIAGQDGSGDWSQGSTNFYTLSPTASFAQVAYSNSYQADLVIGNGGTGGTINLSTNVEVAGPLGFNPLSGTNSYTLTGTNSLQLDAGIVSANTTTINVPVVLDATSGTSTFSSGVGTTLTLANGIGEINGPQRLVTSDLGTVVLGGSSSYTGGTQVNQGILQVTTTSLPSTGGLNVAAGANIAFGQSSDGIFSGLISGPGNVIINNSNNSAITLSNTGNSYTGSTTLEAGLLRVDNAGELGTEDGGIVMEGGTIQFNAEGLVFPQTTVNGNTATVTLQGGATSTIDTNGNDVTLGQIFQGSGNLTKAGAGTLVFLSVHSTNEIGILQINAGALVFDEAGLPSFGWTGTPNGVVGYQGDLDIDTPTDVRIFAGNISGGGNINIAAAAGGTIIEGRDFTGVGGQTLTTTISNSINLNGGVTLTLVASGTTDLLQLNAPITGNGSVDYTSGAGFVVLGANSTYSGSTTVDWGASTNGDIALGVNNAMPVGTDLHVTGAGLLDMAGFNQKVASLDGGSGAIIENVTGTGVSILTISGSTTTSYNGEFLDGQNGQVGLTLDAANTGWLMLGTNNLNANNQPTGMSGPLTIIGGRLEVDTLSALGAPSTITVGADAGNSQIHFNALVGTLTYASALQPTGATASPIILNGTGGYTPSMTYHPGALNVENGSDLVLPSPITLAANSDISLDATSTLVLQGNVSGAGALEISAAAGPGGTITFAGVNSFTGGLTVDSTVVATAATALPTNGPIANNGSLTVLTGSTVGQVTGGGALTIGAVGHPITIQLANNTTTSTVGSLTINNGSKLDITNNTLAINYGSPGGDPVATIASQLANGYAGGAWTGTTGTAGVITSSTAAGGTKPVLSVGYDDGNADNGAAGGNQIVVKYTLAGDANLDGSVNSADLLAVVQNFNKTGTDWAHGNFTYVTSGQSTTSADLLIVVQNFNQTLSPAGSSGVALGGEGTLGLATGVKVQGNVPVPEPGSFALIAAGSGALLARRRRGRKA